MANIEQLLENNRSWASSVERERPGFFDKLARRQAPEFFWIGCSDSRVSANHSWIYSLCNGRIRVLATPIHSPDHDGGTCSKE